MPTVRPVHSRNMPPASSRLSKIIFLSASRREKFIRGLSATSESKLYNKTVNSQFSHLGIITAWQTTNTYRASLEWRQEVDQNLRRENGWLALAGLFWLRKGTNLIGSDPESDILLPERAPTRLGTFEFDGDNVRLKVEVRFAGGSQWRRDEIGAARY